MENKEKSFVSAVVYVQGIALMMQLQWRIILPTSIRINVLNAEPARINVR